MNLLDGWFKFPVGEGAFYAVFGFIFVFAGITLLILFFTLLGMIMKRINERGARKRTAAQEQVAAPTETVDGEISPEELAVITAAIAAYTEGEPVKCDFVVRRIKRL